MPSFLPFPFSPNISSPFSPVLRRATRRGQSKTPLPKTFGGGVLVRGWWYRRDNRVLRAPGERCSGRCECFLRSTQFTPAMYRARRPQLVHLSVTCEWGCGGACAGSRMICPSQLGQLRGSPVRSAAIKCSACAGLYVFGRGLRITPPHGKSAAIGECWPARERYKRLIFRNTILGSFAVSTNRLDCIMVVLL